RAFRAPAAVKHGKPRATLPGFIPPQLATLRDRPPNGASFVHEVKFDGYRMQARLEDGRVRLLTRQPPDWPDKVKPVVDAVAALAAERAVVAGEVVVEAAQGVSSFAALQDALKHGKANFVYYVFDLLYLNGTSLLDAPLVERKAALEHLLNGTDRN